MKKIFPVMLLLLGMNKDKIQSVEIEESTNPTIIVDGLPISQTGIKRGWLLFLPLREISERLGYLVSWDEATRTATVITTVSVITIDLTNELITIDGHELPLAGNYMIQDNSLYMLDTFFNNQMLLGVTYESLRNEVSVRTFVLNEVKILTESIAYETDRLKVNLQFPLFVGLENTEAELRLNSLSKSVALDATYQGKLDADGLSQDQVDKGYKAEVYVNYEITLNRNGLISLFFLEYHYAGGAHGNSRKRVLNYDVIEDRFYFLEDLFKPNSNYIGIISADIRRQIEERNITGILTPFTEIQGYQYYYLTNTALVVFFQEYEYFAYVYGIQDFPIDYRLLKSSFKPEIAERLLV